MAQWERGRPFNHLVSVLDEHAPLQKKVITIRPNTKWFNNNIRRAKIVRRRLERRFIKSGSDINRKAYQDQCKLVNYLIKEAKTKFNAQKIAASKHDKKKLFESVKEILCWKHDPVLPSKEISVLPNDFVHFFIDKIVKINGEISSQVLSDLENEVESFIEKQCHSILAEFEPATIDEVAKIIKNSSSATCEIDAMPTNLLKDCCTQVAPIITDIVNISLKNAEVPLNMKKAVIRPLLKKATANPEILKNYRPVSNLGFVSKILEKIVANRIKSYIDYNNLHTKMQSAYKSFHSTETALLKVHNDIAQALDKKNIAAFDTIRHSVLLERLQHRYGIESNALKWIESYLKDRTQYVSINGYKSEEKPLDTGVPQGSILGPLLFSLYVSPLADIVENCGVNGHYYADDSQLYVCFDRKTELADNISKLENCISKIRVFMRYSFLKLNEDKTEILLFGSPHNLKSLSKVKIKVGHCEIESSNVARNLGAVFDSTLSMTNFISAKCQSAMYFIRAIHHIRKTLDRDTIKTLINSLVTSRLDYSNSILLGATKSSLKPIQRVQYAAARLISESDFRQPMTPILRELHWLPISHRVNFKVLTMCYQCVYGTAPTYLCELVSLYKPKRILRSAQDNLLLTVSSHKTKFAQKCFALQAPILWNRLPYSIRASKSLAIFKRDLKTYLFTSYFS